MPKRASSFNAELNKDFPFLSAKDGAHTVCCTLCNTNFSISHGGRSDINDHIKSKKHKTSQNAQSSSATVTNFFTKKLPSFDEKKLAAAEGTFAYHTVTHNHSFRSMDCTSSLVKKLFDPKFACARTKSEAIVTNVLAAVVIKEVVTQLDQAKFVTIALDTSNHNALKLAPILVRYFLPSLGIKTKILEFQSIQGETSDILSEYVLSVLEKYVLQQKLLGFVADNTNTNFGGAERKGQKNLFKKLTDKMNRNVIGVSCGAHIVHNAAKTACDMLPVDVEIAINKIFSYFHIYTVRVEKLKDFCEFAEVEYKAVLGSGATRWLSLLPAVERTLSLFEALKLFFREEPRCPIFLKNFFDDPCSELWLWFVHNQMSLFNVTLLNIQKEDATASEIVSELNVLKGKLLNRRDEKFLSLKVKSLLRELQSGNNITIEKLQATAASFYQTAFDYIEKWDSHFCPLSTLSWTSLSIAPTWTEVESSLCVFTEFATPMQLSVDDNNLFDEVTCLRNFLSDEKLSEWQQKSTTTSAKWVEVFSTLRSRNILMPNLELLVGFALCIPGTNASIERVFSLMNATWSDDMSRLSVDTLKARLLVKHNFDKTCSEFHEYLLTQPKILEKIHSSAKYS